MTEQTHTVHSYHICTQLSHQRAKAQISCDHCTHIFRTPKAHDLA